MLKFRQRFRLLRGSMNQVEFANKVGITKQKVSNYENGIVKPTFDVLRSLAEELNVNINWLLTGFGDMYIKPPDYLNTKQQDKYNKAYDKVADKRGHYGKNNNKP